MACTLVILIPTSVLASLHAHVTDLLLLHDHDQTRIRCLAVQCPAERPRCVLQNHLATCVPDSDTNTRNSRLSRTAPSENKRESLTNTAQALGVLAQSKNPHSLGSTSSLINNGDTVGIAANTGASPGVTGGPGIRQSATGLPATKPGDIGNAARRPGVTNVGNRNLDSCLQAPESGRCRAYFPRYYYNPNTRRCESFVFGGCGGNSNNFQTLSECFRACALPLSETGRSRPRQPDTVYVTGQNANFGGGNLNNNLNRNNNINNNMGNNINNNNNLGSSQSHMSSGIDNSGFIQNQVDSLLNSNLFFSAPETNEQLLSKPINSIFPDFTQHLFPNEHNKQSQLSFPRPVGPSPSQPQFCNLDADPGLCLAFIPRYFFNSITQQCERFNYGGCGGNQNNFNTWEGCVTRCKPAGGTMTAQGQVQTARPNNPTSRNEQTSTGFATNPSTGQNLNPSTGSRQQTGPRQSSQKPRLCFVPPDRRLCLAQAQRYFYNPQTNTCQVFAYGGCRGNQNNFRTFSACQRVCIGRDQSVDRSNGQGNVQIQPQTTGSGQGEVSSVTSHCYLRPDPGPCRARIPRYFYNSQAKRCQSFNYGGCQGNENNFRSLVECRSSCDRFGGERNVDISQQIPSMMPSTPGRENQQFPLPVNSRFPLSTQLPQTSATNLNTQTSVRPSSRPQFCSLRSETGPCRAYIPRYFYNPQSGKCESFIYGGCQPNQNNFPTKQECSQTCAAQSSPNSSWTNNGSGQVNPTLSPQSNDLTSHSPMNSRSLLSGNSGITRI